MLRPSARVEASRVSMLAALAALVLAAPTSALVRDAGPPTASGPLSQAAGACTNGTCALDYTLAPSATSDPTDAWHAFWITTPAAAAARPGWCTIEVTDAISWGDGSAPAPTRTYPPAGTSAVGPAAPASLLVDAAGRATDAGQLRGEAGWPAGLATTATGPGYMTVVWQGRSAAPVPLLLAAEVRNPPAFAADQGVETSSVGVPCAHVAPPGATFLVRVVPAAVRLGGTAWLQLRIPGTQYAWTIGATVSTVGGGSGSANIRIESRGPFGRSSAKPFSLGVFDRTSLPLKEPFPGRYTCVVTLRGPTGARRFSVGFTVRG